MPEEIERTSQKTKDKLAEIEKAVKALLRAMQDLEKEQGEVYMPQGEYLGIKFDE